MSTPIDRRFFLRSAAGWVLAGSAVGRPDLRSTAETIDVRGRGVVGNGIADDAAAINRLIAQTSAAGGGSLYFPSGTYPCRYTVYLQSHVHIFLERGAVIKAAPAGTYDTAEKNQNDGYQDFGHSHWRNSLICGIGLRDIAISGPGRISGIGLSCQEWPLADGTRSALLPGVADKIIALKNCTDVTLEDFTIDGTGHFAVLATGVDRLKIRRLLIDAARDGINLDSCWEADVEDCVLNVPYDDGVCIKASLALGDARGSRNIRVRRCRIYGGFEVGTLRDGSRRLLPTRLGRKGRFKIGTESSGGFEDILFEDCHVEDGQGLLLTSVDGGNMRGVRVRNFTARRIQNSPLFVWLGDRLRGPPGTTVGTIADINISGFTCYEYKDDDPLIISGLPAHSIEGISLSDAYLLQQGGGLQEETYIIPPAMDRRYPETSLLGQKLPAQGLFARHVDRLALHNIEFASVMPDRRPFIWLSGVCGRNISGVRVPDRTTAPVVYEPRPFEGCGSSRLAGPREAARTAPAARRATAGLRDGGLQHLFDGEVLDGP